ncbi:hypothetical protein PoB_002158000 [Plakobranchus ocellatus]|uniref:Uncharacterized protein n=1 Tax=Plakobranchus ocellatus TaxID=259542 RepID=A0AAV3ZHH5_9GAST|nr:hypothetical protein PoB_002158000 [Plakobranchus ocellatus]
MNVFIKHEGFVVTEPVAAPLNGQGPSSGQGAGGTGSDPRQKDPYRSEDESSSTSSSLSYARRATANYDDVTKSSPMLAE